MSQRNATLRYERQNEMEGRDASDWPWLVWSGRGGENGWSIEASLGVLIGPFHPSKVSKCPDIMSCPAPARQPTSITSHVVRISSNAITMAQVKALVLLRTEEPDLAVAPTKDERAALERFQHFPNSHPSPVLVFAESTPLSDPGLPVILAPLRHICGARCESTPPGCRRRRRHHRAKTSKHPPTTYCLPGLASCQRRHT